MRKKHLERAALQSSIAEIIEHDLGHGRISSYKSNRASAHKFQVANITLSRNESVKAALNRLALILIFEGSFLSKPIES